MPVVSAENSEHYTWGERCSGWHLLKSSTISVIEDAVLGSGEAFGRRDNHLLVYPNPAQDRLNLVFRLEQPGLVNYHLADLLGRPVLQGRQQVAAEQALELSLAELPAGAYLLVVDINGDRLARRVVKSR